MRRRMVEMVVCGAVVAGALCFCAAMGIEMSLNGYPTTLQEAYPDSDDPLEGYKADLEWYADEMDRQKRVDEHERKWRAKR